jgi:transposase
MIIVDLEKNEVVDLLPDREANGRRSATLTTWLKLHSSVETVSRDRSSTYASAITKTDDKIGQTGGVPLADRWHILKNLTEGFDGVSGGVPLNTQRENLRDISAELSEEQQLLSESIIPEINEIAKKETVITGRYHITCESSHRLKVK